MSSANNASFQNIFKNENEIPEEYKVPEIHQKVYLLNGELVEWKGETQNIYSLSVSLQKTVWKENCWAVSRTLALKKPWKFLKPA